MNSTDLHDLRDAMGLTQAELAARLGVTLLTVNRWERGQSIPRISHDRKLRTLRSRVPKSTTELTIKRATDARFLRIVHLTKESHKRLSGRLDVAEAQLEEIKGLVAKMLTVLFRDGSGR